MKKKNLKSLNLNKKSISNFQHNSIKGKGITLAYQICLATLKGPEIMYSLFFDCHPTFDSCACADTQNDDSCQCTVA